MNFKNTFIASSLTVALSLGAVALLTATSSFAYDETSTSSINVDAAQVILKGYDSVSYFKGQPVQGDKRFAATHDGATYYFANAENLQAFQANPAKFAPQYGGYCAYGVAKDNLVSIEPDKWKVLNGKLYLNSDGDVQKKWLVDPAGFIKTADGKFSKLLKK